MTPTGHKDQAVRLEWKIGQSIAVELDVAIAAVRDYAAGANMPAEFASLLRSIPEDWRENMPAPYGMRRRNISVMETAATLAGVLQENSYGQATLAIRNLSLPDAVRRLGEMFAPLGLFPDQSLSGADQLADLGMRGRLALYHSLGVEIAADSPVAQSALEDYRGTAKILAADGQSEEFWFWMDRFYFTYYHPWRNSRQAHLAAEEERAEAALGGRDGRQAPAGLDWLAPQNPLLRIPHLRQAVEAGAFKIYFWNEPFGVADMWAIYPGLILIAYAQPGEMFQNFRETVTDIAGRVNAIADPTRLTILRLIRHFGMVNTEIANYLGISRPTVSIHARILREAGLIESEQVGREMKHTVRQDELHRLFNDLERILDLPEQPDR